MSLWAPLIASVYGVEGGLAVRKASAPGGYWPAILTAGRDIDASAVVFEKNFRKAVRRGNWTRFWLDTWVGQTLLSIQFGGLFALDLNKDCLVQDRIFLSNQVINFSWEWRHSPLGREFSELEGLLSCFHNQAALNDDDDSWVWSASSNGAYQVRDISSALDNARMIRSEDPILWCKLFSKKINLFVWRVQRHFFPSLAMRGISLDSLTCPLYSSEAKDVNHAFFTCALAQKVWDAAAIWWSFSTLALSCCDDVFSSQISALPPAIARCL